MKFTIYGRMLVDTPAFIRWITEVLANDKYFAYVMLAMYACVDVPDASDDQVEDFVRSHWKQLARLMSDITAGTSAKQRVRGKQRHKNTKQR
jgi:hypothetical protein